jgi:hypothetical protein
LTGSLLILSSPSDSCCPQHGKAIVKEDKPVEEAGSLIREAYFRDFDVVLGRPNNVWLLKNPSYYLHEK